MAKKIILSLKFILDRRLFLNIKTIKNKIEKKYIK